MRVTTERYDDGYTTCPKCGSCDIEFRECKMLGEQEVTCNDCGHTLFYYCKADERD